MQCKIESLPTDLTPGKYNMFHMCACTHTHKHTYTEMEYSFHILSYVDKLLYVVDLQCCLGLRCRAK